MIGLKHSIHHRGQLSMYLRPMGAKVPSIYGESYDSAQATQGARVRRADWIAWLATAAIRVLDARAGSAGRDDAGGHCGSGAGLAGNGAGRIVGTVQASGTAVVVLEPKDARTFPAQSEKPVMDQVEPDVRPRTAASCAPASRRSSGTATTRCTT